MMPSDPSDASGSGADSRSLIVYHHIHKTAGASVRLVVKENYAADELLESYEAPHRNEWYRLWWNSFTADEKAAARCIAGHTANHVFPALDRPFRAFTILRDPVERVISLYYYWLERYAFMKTQAPGGGRMRHATVGVIEREGWSLEDIYKQRGDGQQEESAEHDLFGAFFNGQVRALAGPHSNVASMAYAKGSWKEGSLHLQSALDHMARHYVVGLQDDLEQAIDRFAQEFGWQRVFTPRVNVTAHEGRHQVSDKTRKLIRRYNALDIELYERVREAGGKDAGARQGGSAGGRTRAQSNGRGRESSLPVPFQRPEAADGALDGQGAAHTTGNQLQALQRRAEHMLETALSEQLLSESPHQSTGNAYQTIRLGEHSRGGFRLPRPNLLAGFELEHRSACDLGANLGEISRDLRRAGASRVDAYEYDRFFTQLARYATAYNGLTDIAHMQADVSEQGFMRDRYDVCVGLSAFSFMRQNIDYICDQTAELMILETHEVRDGTWHKRYVGPIACHLPHWCCFGRVAHGAASSDKWRLWLAFSRTELGSFYERRSHALVPGGEGLVEIDLTRSTLPQFDKAGLAAEQRDAHFSKQSQREYSDTLEEHERRFQAGEKVNLSMAAEPYWLALLCGIAQFADDGGLEESNVYLTWMTRAIESGAIDPGLRPMLDDPEALHRRVSLRLEQFGDALRNRDPGHLRGMPIAFNATPSHPCLETGFNFKRLVLSGSDEVLCVPMLDGHHRLFVLKLLGVERCPVMTIWDPAALSRPKSLARVENYEQRMYQYLAGGDVDDPVVVP